MPVVSGRPTVPGTPTRNLATPAPPKLYSRALTPTVPHTVHQRSSDMLIKTKTRPLPSIKENRSPFPPVPFAKATPNNSQANGSTERPRTFSVQQIRRSDAAASALWQYKDLLIDYARAENPREAFNILKVDMEEQVKIKLNDACISTVIGAYYKKAHEYESDLKKDLHAKLTRPDGSTNPWLEECIENFHIQDFLDTDKEFYPNATQNLADIYRKSYVWNGGSKTYRPEESIKLCDRVLDRIDISNTSNPPSNKHKECYYATWVIKLTILYNIFHKAERAHKNALGNPSLEKAHQSASQNFDDFVKDKPSGFDKTSKSWTRFRCVQAWKGGHTLKEALQIQEDLYNAPQRNGKNKATKNDIGNAIHDIDKEIKNLFQNMLELYSKDAPLTESEAHRLSTAASSVSDFNTTLALCDSPDTIIRVLRNMREKKLEWDAGTRQILEEKLSEDELTLAKWNFLRTSPSPDKKKKAQSLDEQKKIQDLAHTIFSDQGSEDEVSLPPKILPLSIW